MSHHNDLALLSLFNKKKNKGTTTTSTMIADKTHNMNNKHDNRQDAYAGVNIAEPVCSYKSHEYDDHARSYMYHREGERVKEGGVSNNDNH